MTEVGCYIDGCTYTSRAVMLGHHLSTAHPVPATAKTPPIHKPRVSLKIHEDAWDCFTREWDVFKQASSIPEGRVRLNFVNYCEADPKASVQKDDPQITGKTEAENLNAIKRNAVINVASSIL